MARALPIALAAAVFAAGAGGGSAGSTSINERGVLAGRVFLVEGNCQRGSPDDPTGCLVRPVSRKVLVFTPPLRMGAFRDANYVGHRAPAVASWSRADGRYAIRLRPAEYSVLVRKVNGRLYCNQFASGAACQVSVQAATRTEHDVRIEAAPQ
jgi:hypothetical protein